MSESERINYSYRCTYGHRLVLGVAEYKRSGWRGQFQKWGYFICVAAAIAIEVVILRRFLSNHGVPEFTYKFVLLGGAATIAAMFLAMSVYCFAQRLVGESLSRDAGLRHRSLSADGVTEERGVFNSRCEWAGIIGVERAPKVTMLPMGDGTGYIISHDVLLDGVTADVLHDRITEWRKTTS